MQAGRHRDRSPAIVSVEGERRWSGIRFSLTWYELQEGKRRRSRL